MPVCHIWRQSDKMLLVCGNISRPDACPYTATSHKSKERVAKENGSYYLLKKTSVPIVIVECGFLSNDREAELLQTEEHRNISYFNSQSIANILNKCKRLRHTNIQLR